MFIPTRQGPSGEQLWTVGTSEVNLIINTISLGERDYLARFEDQRGILEVLYLVTPGEQKENVILTKSSRWEDVTKVI